MNKLRKQINRLLTKGMPNIYLKVTRKTGDLKTSGSKTVYVFSIILILKGVMPF